MNPYTARTVIGPSTGLFEGRELSNGRLVSTEELLGLDIQI